MPSLESLSLRIIAYPRYPLVPWLCFCTFLPKNERHDVEGSALTHGSAPVSLDIITVAINSKHNQIALPTSVSLPFLFILFILVLSISPISLLSKLGFC